MTTTDPFAAFKQQQRQGWSHFAPIEVHTTPTAGHVVRFAGVRAGQSVLDIGTGTGVVALTARRLGAKVAGVDLTPALLERAREHARLAELEDIEWREGDAEALPYADGSFDVVVSQFGHMFAPRPEVALDEALRVLKPGGVLAFATWPPEQLIGKVFATVGRYLPPPPGVSPPVLWGDPGVVRERLGTRVRELFFERGVLRFGVLSLQHYRDSMERTVGPIIKVVDELEANPQKLATFRKELEELARPYFDDNVVRQEYLLTRARKV